MDRLEKFLRDNPGLRAAVPGAKDFVPEIPFGFEGEGPGEDEPQIPEIVQEPEGNTTAEKVQNEAEKHSVDALRTLVNVMHDREDKSHTGKTRTLAALGILDRALGRPRQTIYTNRGKGEAPDFNNLSTEELEQYEKLLQKALKKNDPSSPPTTPGQA